MKIFNFSFLTTLFLINTNYVLSWGFDYYKGDGYLIAGTEFCDGDTWCNIKQLAGTNHCKDFILCSGTATKDTVAPAGSRGLNLLGQFSYVEGCIRDNGENIGIKLGDIENPFEECGVETAFINTKQCYTSPVNKNQYAINYKLNGNYDYVTVRNNYYLTKYGWCKNDGTNKPNNNSNNVKHPKEVLVSNYSPIYLTSDKKCATYVCRKATIKNNKYVYSTCYKYGSLIKNEIIPSNGGYQHPDNCMIAKRDINASHCYADKRGEVKIRNKTKHKNAVIYDTYNDYALSEYGWCRYVHK